MVNPIRRVPGVARVDLDGVAPQEIFIDLILDRVKEHRVDVGQLVQQLQGSSTNMVLGQVDDSGLRYSARSLGEFGSVEELEALVVDPRGLRLADIAEVRYEEPPIAYGRHLGQQYAIALQIYKESTANTVEVVQAVQSVLRDEIDNDPLLNGVNLFFWEDQAEEITQGIDGLKTAGLIGGVLAVFSLFFFLRRFDSTIIVSLSIPFSIIAACGVLYFMGKSLNILSMMGLMLAVGMLVDNAIVVLESIDRNLREEPDRVTAALSGAQQVMMAVTASTVTTLIVFLPLVVGADTDLTTWLREVGITISIALGCSLFSSLTLIPLCSAHFLKKRDELKPSRFLTWLEDRYARTLGWTLEHKVKTAVILIVCLVVGFLPFPLKLVKTGMFSATVNKRLYLEYEFSDFVYKSQAEKAVNQVEDYLYSRADDFMVDSVYSYYTENEAGTTITLSRMDLDDDDIKELRTRIREDLPEIPGARAYFYDDTQGGGSSTYFAVKLFGQDSMVLSGLAEEAARRLETVEGIEDVTTPFRSGRKEIHVSLDPEKAAGLNLTPQDLSEIFAFTLGGLRLPRFNAGEREVESWIALRLEDRENLEDLKSIEIRSSGGRPVRLGDVARFDMVERPQEIRRENRKVRVAVNATYEGESWDEAKGEITNLMDSLSLPGGYSWGWNDRIIEREGQNQQMGINFLLALVLVYLVMASLFESLAQPFAILFSILFSIPGAVWLLAATRTPFNLMAQIGLLILMGIVVNNGIVLLDRVNQRRAEGFSPEDAIVQAGRDRLRPILMTASTTIIGLLPLGIGGVNVSGLLYFPMARTVMGGLVSSAALTLLVLPYVSLLIERLGLWARGIWRRSGRKKFLESVDLAEAGVQVAVDGR